jgi:gluconate 2-dehydrogenase gamma chain
MSGDWSRRDVLKKAAAVSAATTVSRRAWTQRLSARASAPFETLDEPAARTLEAIVSRLIPSDENGPGALEAGAARYIDRALADAFAVWRPAYTDGLAAVDRHAQQTAGRPFAELGPADQDTVLADIEQSRAAGFTPDSATFFDLVLEHTIQGTFCDPRYGGNQDFLGWDMIAYPGIRLGVAADQQAIDARPEPTRISAYDLPMFDAAAPRAEDGDDR